MITTSGSSYLVCLAGVVEDVHVERGVLEDRVGVGVVREPEQLPSPLAAARRPGASPPWRGGGSQLAHGGGLTRSREAKRRGGRPVPSPLAATLASICSVELARWNSKHQKYAKTNTEFRYIRVLVQPPPGPLPTRGGAAAWRGGGLQLARGGGLTRARGGEKAA